MQTRGLFNTLVCGLTASKPGFPGLITSVLRPARVDGKLTVSSHWSETDLRSIGSFTVVAGG